MSEAHSLYAEAETLMDEERNDEAVAKLNEILALDESFALAHLALARVYLKLGKAEEAVRHGERACELEPNDQFNFTAMSVTYQKAFQLTRNSGYIRKAEEAMARAHMLH